MIYEYVRIEFPSYTHCKEFISHHLNRFKHHWLEHSHHATLILSMDDWLDIASDYDVDGGKCDYDELDEFNALVGDYVEFFESEFEFL